MLPLVYPTNVMLISKFTKSAISFQVLSDPILMQKIGNGYIKTLSTLCLKTAQSLVYPMPNQLPLVKCVPSYSALLGYSICLGCSYSLDRVSSVCKEWLWWFGWTYMNVSNRTPLFCDLLRCSPTSTPLYKRGSKLTSFHALIRARQ